MYKLLSNKGGIQTHFWTVVYLLKLTISIQQPIVQRKKPSCSARLIFDNYTSKYATSKVKAKNNIANTTVAL